MGFIASSTNVVCHSTEFCYYWNVDTAKRCDIGCVRRDVSGGGCSHLLLFGVGLVKVFGLRWKSVQFMYTNISTSPPPRHLSGMHAFQSYIPRPPLRVWVDSLIPTHSGICNMGGPAELKHDSINARLNGITTENHTHGWSSVPGDRTPFNNELISLDANDSVYSSYQKPWDVLNFAKWPNPNQGPVRGHQECQAIAINHKWRIKYSLIRSQKVYRHVIHTAECFG